MIGSDGLVELEAKDFVVVGGRVLVSGGSSEINKRMKCIISFRYLYADYHNLTK